MVSSRLGFLLPSVASPGASMITSSIPSRLLALILGVTAATAAVAKDKDADVRPCTEDAMIVFDASGSMPGDGWGYGSELAGTVSRIDKVRSALREILPSITRFRRVGLLTYGSAASASSSSPAEWPAPRSRAARNRRVA